MPAPESVTPIFTRRPSASVTVSRVPPRVQRRERVADLVGDAGSELAEDGEPPGVQRLGLEGLARRDILDHDDGLHDVAVGAAHRRGDGAQEMRTVRAAGEGNLVFVL